MFRREVDEELRRDQIVAAWRRYGRVGIVIVVAALLLLGGGLWWRHHQEQERSEAGSQLSQALTDLNGRPQAATTALATLAASDVPGYRAEARLTQAEVALARNDAAGAARLFGAVAADDRVGQPLRDLALVRQVAAQFDQLPPQTAIDHLATVRQPGNAFFGSAAELTALAYLKLNRPREAGALYAQILRNPHTPGSLRDRAGAMAASLGVDVSDQLQGSVTQ